MQTDAPNKCRGCGATLSVLNKSLEMSGYCGKCAAQSQQDEDLCELPADVDVSSIANAPLRSDTIRFTSIAVLASIASFGGAIVGAITSGPIGRVEDSLRASWIFCVLALFVGKVIFLRSGNALTFARWKVFWGCFLIAYFVTYIPLALVLPGMDSLPLPADIVTFVLACAVAYAVGMLFVQAQDRTLKSWLCERCALPSPMVEAARTDDWEEAQRLIDELVAQSQSLVSGNNLLARLYLVSGHTKRESGDIEAAAADFGKASEIDGASDAIQFKTAMALNDVGRHSDASDMLSRLVAESRDKDLVGRARKLIKSIHKRNRLNIRCPECGRSLLGTVDMIGDEAVCTKCKTEFTVSEELVSR